MRIVEAVKRFFCCFNPPPEEKNHFVDHAYSLWTLQDDTPLLELKLGLESDDPNLGLISSSYVSISAASGHKSPPRLRNSGYQAISTVYRKENEYHDILSPLAPTDLIASRNPNKHSSSNARGISPR